MGTEPWEQPDSGRNEPPDEHSVSALRGLLDVLDLEAAPGPAADVFVGGNQPQPWGRVFGGQVLAQCLVAAGRTVPAERPVHSLHAYFLRSGDLREPITFAVERLRDGRSFSARRVHALQREQPILAMIASFQVPDVGLDHQAPMPDVPGPEDVPTTAELLAGIDHPAARYWSRERPVDLRHVEAPVYLRVEGDRVAHQAVWLRAVGSLPDDAVLHAAVTAYASDYTMLESVLRRHGIAWATPGLKAASLDHAMWWHRRARADEWLLYVQESPSASGARGLGLGRMFGRDGRLVASVAQEGMVRAPAG